MDNTFVFIDDSGSPGQKPPNKYIAQDTKIWSGVILKSLVKQEIEREIKNLLNRISKEITFSEFHFTDIYSGINDFKGIDAELRLLIFSLFVELYNKYEPYVITIAVGKDTLGNTGFSEKYINIKSDGFSLNKPSDCALYYLLIYIQKYILDNSRIYSLPVEITIDEGRQKADTKQVVSIISTICNEITYKSSKDNCMLQFIDFLAFCLNRIQNNAVKNRSTFDIRFMNIVGNMKLNSNLKTMYVNDIEELNLTFIEENIEKLANREKPSKELLQYIEKLTEGRIILKNVISQNNKQLDDKTKEVLLNNIKEIKNINYDGSEEFKSLIYRLEKLLLEN